MDWKQLKSFDVGCLSRVSWRPQSAESEHQSVDVYHVRENLERTSQGLKSQISEPRRAVQTTCMVDYVEQCMSRNLGNMFAARCCCCMLQAGQPSISSSAAARGERARSGAACPAEEPCWPWGRAGQVHRASQAKIERVYQVELRWA